MITNKGDSREEECMHLMRCLAFFRAKFHFTLYAQHISGTRNDLADALSRDRLHYFMTNHPNVRTLGELCLHAIHPCGKRGIVSEQTVRLDRQYHNSCGVPIKIEVMMKNNSGLKCVYYNAWVFGQGQPSQAGWMPKH